MFELMELLLISFLKSNFLWDFSNGDKYKLMLKYKTNIRFIKIFLLLYVKLYQIKIHYN